MKTIGHQISLEQQHSHVKLRIRLPSRERSFTITATYNNRLATNATKIQYYNLVQYSKSEHILNTKIPRQWAPDCCHITPVTDTILQNWIWHIPNHLLSHSPFFFLSFFFSLLHSHILSQLFYTSQNIIKSYNTLTHSLTTSWKTYVPSTNYCTSLIILTHYHDSFFLLDTLFFFFHTTSLQKRNKLQLRNG